MTCTRILLLPGLDGTGDLFAPLLPYMGNGFEADVVSYPHNKDLGFEELLASVENRIPKGIKHIVLAESFSGPIAIQYALKRQEDVTGVILCASFLRNPLPAVLRWLPRLANSILLSLPLPSTVARMFLVDFDSFPSLVDKVKQAVHKVDACVLANRIRSLSSVNVTTELRELQMPILYLQGTDDKLVGERGAVQVKQASPHSEVLVLKGPHLLLQTNPDEASNAIREFINAIGDR